MKNLLVAGLMLTLAGVASGQTYRSPIGRQQPVRPVATPPPVVQRGDVGGAIPRGVRGGNPLQMLNPNAPAEYGTAAQSVLLEPYTGKWKGIKLFEIFW
jgi:hypothetical protein